MAVAEIKRAGPTQSLGGARNKITPLWRPAIKARKCTTISNKMKRCEQGWGKVWNEGGGMLLEQQVRNFASNGATVVRAH